MSGKKYRGFLAGLVFLAAMPFGTVRAFALESLPGRELWQPYLTQSAQGAADFARDPVSALLSLLPGSPVQLLVDTLHSYADLLLFLLLLTALSFLVGDAADGTLLDLAAAGGCGVLIWGDLLTLAQSIGERMDSWRLFLTGFLPVCGAVLTAGGEGNAGAVASGFLLSVLALLAQGIALCIRPLLQSYLAISMACCIHTQTGLPEACRMSGQLLRKSISAGGKLFALLLGVQRVITLQLDHTTSRLGQMLTGSVPVIGQALSGAADTVLAGLQLLKSSLGIAALVILGAEFNFGQVRKCVRQLVIGVSGRLVVMPLIFLTIAVLLGFRGEELIALLVMLAAPPAVSSFTMAQQMDGDSELAAGLVVFGSSLAVVTMFIWIFVLKSMALI